MFAAIHLPDFALQSALRLEPELLSRAVAVVDPELKPPGILQATPAARSKGVVKGLTSSQAQARCPDLLLKHRSPAQEQSAAETLLQTAATFSPNLEATAPGVCTIALRGLYFKDDAAMRRWANQMVAALAGFHLAAQVGIAATPGLAWLAAQAAAPVLLVQDRGAFLSNLPIEALRPPTEIAAILMRWGVHTVGAFLALGRADVAERLGPSAAGLFDGLEVVRPLQIISPPETFAERVEFPCEVETTEPLLFVLRRILEQLAKRLDLIYLVTAELELRLTLSSGAHHARIFKIPSPTNVLQVLFRMLETHLETLRTDAPIVALELRAQPGRPDQHQFGLFETTLLDPNQFAETLARLTALCGPENAGTPQLEATHQPDAFRLTSPDFSNADAPLPSEPSAARCRRPGMQLRRFRPALPASVVFCEQRPALISSPAVRGAVREVHGPFRNSGGWWDARRWAREEWDAQMVDGVLCRIVRSADGCFVEGVYD